MIKIVLLDCISRDRIKCKIIYNIYKIKKYIELFVIFWQKLTCRRMVKCQQRN